MKTPAAKTVKTAKPVQAAKAVQTVKPVKPVKTIKDLRGLKALKLEIETQARRHAEMEAARLAAARKLKAEQALFAHTVGAVQALPARHQPEQKAKLHVVPPAPVAVQQQLDEQAVMREALSDEFDGDALLETDDNLSYRRPGMGLDVVRKLRRGIWRIQGQLDLHGLRREDARDTLSEFIREAHKTGWRCVRVVHGKGLGSPGKTPVLKGRVQSWLIQKKEVLAFAQARPAEGGAGALVVLLAQS
jgi:DNA-nicking Smr family endonuclease